MDQQQIPRLDPNRPVAIPMRQHPIYRTHLAIQDGVERRLLFKTWGGLGDQICSEPTLRFAFNKFKNCEFFLAAEIPELFAHLNWKKVFNLKEEQPNYSRYLTFETITPPDESNLVWCFFSHLLTNCVDFPAMCALRSQLPVADREIHIHAPVPTSFDTELAKGAVVIHPGKHWQSKTFPKQFWDGVIESLLVLGIKPIIIGANTDDNRGTVDVDASNCYDFRNKLTIMESTWLCQHAGVLLTNDSSPLHMAASKNPDDPTSGRTWIGYMATCKHPDMITHWRNGRWNWREVNFSKGGIWDLVDYCPNNKESIEVEFVDPKILESWLPEPKVIAQWAADVRNIDNYGN